MKKYGFVRVGASVPKLVVADCTYNQEQIVQEMMKAVKEEVGILTFPELSLTGYTCGDLFFQRDLLTDVLEQLKVVLNASEKLELITILGMPLSIDNQLFNCALVIQKGKILGVVPKTYIPNYNEFYEQRWFSSSLDLMKKEVEILGQTVPIGTDLIFRDLDYSEISFGIEICEDLWSVLPPSQDLALNGAHLLFNLSSSNELIGKYQYRRSLVSNQSSKLIAGYVYTSSGVFESSSDVVFSGHALISENGAILTESKRFQFDSEMLIADIDVFKLHTLRIKDISYMGIHPSKPCREIMVHVPDSSTLRRDYEHFPFVPHDLTKRTERCHEIFQIQACGLAKRLHHIHCEKTVIGISGGLDSTLAFLVIVEAYKKLGISTKNIVAITMPGFGTTKRTLDNALKLMKAYDVEVREIPIVEASLLHMKDIGHDPKVYDVAYENIQARERTQILMDVANEVGGIVVGTGDLSELALGWCTYNGDHMSMYAVNNSIPKTLVKYLVRFVADSDEKVKDILYDILDTPISPELLPPTEEGEIEQKTEDKIGPYELHDFFLYHFFRYGASLDKILFLAIKTFEPDYQEEEIKQWLKVFIKRFFSQQFKRNCLPDGPKVGTVSLSPRGDLRMPSDASVRSWLKDLD